MVSCGVRKVAGGRVLRTRLGCEESQKDLVRPIKRAIKWQRKFREEKHKVIFIEKAALVHWLVTDHYQSGVGCWVHASVILELRNR